MYARPSDFSMTSPIIALFRPIDSESPDGESVLLSFLYLFPNRIKIGFILIYHAFSKDSHVLIIILAEFYPVQTTNYPVSMYVNHSSSAKNVLLQGFEQSVLIHHIVLIVHMVCREPAFEVTAGGRGLDEFPSIEDGSLIIMKLCTLVERIHPFPLV